MSRRNVSLSFGSLDYFITLKYIYYPIFMMKNDRLPFVLIANENYYDSSLLLFVFGKKSLLFRARYLYLSVDLLFNSVERYLTLRSIRSNDA
mmetsp:Transcript_37946/g.38373  ORF Transcript_37946/g.38373 Transcript_37946/m.38373 type:complete len:92 (-) Transcript_37946:144-419(-)